MPHGRRCTVTSDRQRLAARQRPARAPTEREEKMLMMMLTSPAPRREEIAGDKDEGSDDIRGKMASEGEESLR